MQTGCQKMDFKLVSWKLSQWRQNVMHMKINPLQEQGSRLFHAAFYYNYVTMKPDGAESKQIYQWL
jgi:hypothetical protein